MMMRKKNSSAKRRKYFLLDSNQTVRKKPKATRNRALNTLAKLHFFRQFGALFRASALLTIACIIMLSFTLFAVFSPYFNLRQALVTRDNPHIDVQAVENLIGEFYGQNLLFISKTEISERLLETFPEFREVKLTEKWPNTLEVEVTLSPPYYQVLNEFDATFSVLSEDGVVLRQEAAEGLPVIKLIKYEQSLQSGEKFADAALLQDITYLRDFFTEELKITIDEIRYLPIALEVHLVSDNGTAFWFDLRAEVEQQARKINLVADEINLYTQTLEHVDLRIPNQVFWKP
jgi:hypothetical protein